MTALWVGILASEDDNHVSTAVGTVVGGVSTTWVQLVVYKGSCEVTGLGNAHLSRQRIPCSPVVFHQVLHRQIDRHRSLLARILSVPLYLNPVVNVQVSPTARCSFPS